jgi:hypothetical protein
MSRPAGSNGRTVNGMTRSAGNGGYGYGPPHNEVESGVGKYGLSPWRIASAAT